MHGGAIRSRNAEHGAEDDDVYVQGGGGGGVSIKKPLVAPRLVHTVFHHVFSLPESTSHIPIEMVLGFKGSHARAPVSFQF